MAPAASASRLPQLLGCDFSSSPSRKKPIVHALGMLGASSRSVRLQGFEHFHTLDAWSVQLQQDAAWVGGFDMPFGLPRSLVEALAWPSDWRACMQHYAGLSRQQIREQFKAFCAARPAGQKFAHRATDGPAGSSPSMKWVNPPVAFMLHAGVPRLLAADVSFPGLLPSDSGKVALEAYPGLPARELIGRRSYKSDDAKRQTAERAEARQDCLAALLRGENRLQLRLQASAELQQQMLADASGDHLDAVICMLQAGWALLQHLQGDALYGMPPHTDALEGWIVTAPLSR